jgi:hypothetical protein
MKTIFLRAATTENPSLTKFPIHVYYSDLRRATEFKKISVRKTDRTEKLAHTPLQKNVVPTHSMASLLQYYTCEMYRK